MQGLHLTISMKDIMPKCILSVVSVVNLAVIMSYAIRSVIIAVLSVCAYLRILGPKQAKMQCAYMFYD